MGVVSFLRSVGDMSETAFKQSTEPRFPGFWGWLDRGRYEGRWKKMSVELVEAWDYELWEFRKEVGALHPGLEDAWVPLGTMNDRWRTPLSLLRQGDEIWRFYSCEASWQQMMGDMGIALVRKGKVVYSNRLM